jgi:hypothetical protein
MPYAAQGVKGFDDDERKLHLVGPYYAKFINVSVWLRQTHA